MLHILNTFDPYKQKSVVNKCSKLCVMNIISIERFRFSWKNDYNLDIWPAVQSNLL